ncbi:type II toxin-antitoxin system VapC family toxin [Acidisphaera sp. L21]|uniref:type II toxin-antitoxin system VapC family toxin n=1 Tax=Acidisphaera sp. L21 TaxID=1641851 RepID=UPI00131C6F88|nr:type II toxin-antitoxin system VapC family toxin [Acidisphaera sp. L21]
MILLDTNILSELMRADPNPHVEQWLGGQPDASIFISAITEAELRYGAALLPSGKRRLALTAEIEAMLKDDFSGRILPFDSLAAQAFATIAAGRRQAGKPISQADAQIASIARSRGASLATRKVDEFAGCEVEIINPWELG